MSRASLVLAVGMLVVVLSFSCFTQIVGHYQGANAPSIHHPNREVNTARFSRCRSTSHVNHIPSSDHRERRPLRIGLVKTGDEIARHVEHFLFSTPKEQITYEHFSHAQMDVFDAHGYPPSIDGWVVYGGHFESARWQHIPPYGLIGLSSENCHNTLVYPTPAFGLLPYGDCALIDNDRFFAMPLGPQLNMHPLFHEPSYPPPVSSRTTLVNGRFTSTPRKPSRMRWLREAQTFCARANAQCELNTDWLNYVPFLPMITGDRYVSLLRDSVFTLCPSGNNYEQYRIWEAIAAGSIPIVEDVTHELESETYVSPSYGLNYFCVPSDVHAVLRATDAPVLYAKNETHMVHLLKTTSLTHASVLQARLLRWRESLRANYTALFSDLAHRFFAPQNIS